jgi:hypothetical protein
MKKTVIKRRRRVPAAAQASSTAVTWNAVADVHASDQSRSRSSSQPQTRFLSQTPIQPKSKSHSHEGAESSASPEQSHSQHLMAEQQAAEALVAVGRSTPSNPHPFANLSSHPHSQTPTYHHEPPQAQSAPIKELDPHSWRGARPSSQLQLHLQPNEPHRPTHSPSPLRSLEMEDDHMEYGDAPPHGQRRSPASSRSSRRWSGTGMTAGTTPPIARANADEDEDDHGYCDDDDNDRAGEPEGKKARLSYREQPGSSSQQGQSSNHRVSRLHQASVDSEIDELSGLDDSSSWHSNSHPHHPNMSSISMRALVPRRSASAQSHHSHRSHHSHHSLQSGSGSQIVRGGTPLERLPELNMPMPMQPSSSLPASLIVAAGMGEGERGRDRDVGRPLSAASHYSMSTGSAGGLPPIDAYMPSSSTVGGSPPSRTQYHYHNPHHTHLHIHSHQVSTSSPLSGPVSVPLPSSVSYDNHHPSLSLLHPNSSAPEPMPTRAELERQYTLMQEERTRLVEVLSATDRMLASLGRALELGEGDGHDAATATQGLLRRSVSSGSGSSRAGTGAGMQWSRGDGDGSTSVLLRSNRGDSSGSRVGSVWAIERTGTHEGAMSQ